MKIKKTGSLFKNLVIDYPLVISYDQQCCAGTRTFNIERTTIFIFSFCAGLVTQLNGSALGLLKHLYITKSIRKPLIGN